MENNEMSWKRPTQRTKATEWRLEQSFQQVVSELEKKVKSLSRVRLFATHGL